MSKSKIENIRHRAICEDDTFKGKWRKNIIEADEDAEKHTQMPGNERHIVRIITEQTASVKFTKR